VKLKNIIIEDKKDKAVFEFKEIKDKTISDISRFFTKNNINSCVITKDKKPYYILTATDIIDALVAHYDNMNIATYIEKNPKKVITISEEEAVFEAYRLMRSYRIHHLIIVDKQGNYKAVINFNDFASYLTEIALKDEMTGLYNKRFFEFIIDRYKNEDIEIGLIFIDLDNFKKINDIYGHMFGDRVLKKVASIIKHVIRDIDYAFRFGGDEFVVMVFTSNEVLAKISNRIKNTIKNTVVDNVKLECSIGYAHFPTDSNNLEKVLKLADERMYKEKKANKR